jgi:hypothetical protein
MQRRLEEQLDIVKPDCIMAYAFDRLGHQAPCFGGAHSCLQPQQLPAKLKTHVDAGKVRLHHNAATVVLVYTLPRRDGY